MRVYLEGTGKGDAVTAFAQLSNAAVARRIQVMVEDPLASGSGRFFIVVKNAITSENAIAVVRAMLDQVAGGAVAFELSPAQQ